jgi:hypothetical protein
VYIRVTYVLASRAFTLKADPSRNGENTNLLARLLEPGHLDDIGSRELAVAHHFERSANMAILYMGTRWISKTTPGGTLMRLP